MIKKEYETPKCETLEFSSAPIMTSGFVLLLTDPSNGESITWDSEFNPW